MEYLFDRDSSSITERILKLNNVSKQDIDVSCFYVDYNQDALVKFKDFLLANTDKKVLLVGDYDCDGVCATVISKKLLDFLKIENNYYIPSRVKEGYGLNESIVDTAIKNHFDAIMMVDNGVSASNLLQKCKEAGIITMIIDHHEYQGTVNCDCFLHSNLLAEAYHNMCAGGLCCLLSNMFYQDDLIDCLGGLATLADMVGVLGYNRYLIKKTIEILNTKDIYQFKYLLDNLSDSYSYTDLSFTIIPKINAVSRLNGNVNHLVKYFLADRQTCLSYINAINEYNTNRRKLTKSLSDKAFKLINENDEFIIIDSEEITEGLCGLIANKLLHEIGKPILVFSKLDGVYKGSGRSFENLDLFSFLKEKEELYSAFGGHAQAVGLTIKEENFSEFKKYVNDKPLHYEDVKKNVIVLNESDLSIKTLLAFKDLEPFGVDFREPLFAIENINSYRYSLVKDKYPKFTINNDAEAIDFNGHEFEDASIAIGELKENYFRGNYKMSLYIEDLV